MRNVMFKKWIPSKYEAGKLIENTGCWEKDFIHEGKFHEWGSTYETFEANAGNYTIAIVELTDGTIAEVLPSNLKFV